MKKDIDTKYALEIMEEHARKHEKKLIENIFNEYIWILERKEYSPLSKGTEIQFMLFANSKETTTTIYKGYDIVVNPQEDDEFIGLNIFGAVIDTNYKMSEEFAIKVFNRIYSRFGEYGRVNLISL